MLGRDVATVVRSFIFDAVKRLRGGKPFELDDIKLLDDAIDAALGIAPVVRRIGPQGLALIKRSEGLRLEAYKDPVGILTIGYGSTGAHVKPGMKITEQMAEQLLLDDLDRFERGVGALAGKMTPGQFSALVSFSFNVGLTALETSTLLKKHLAGNYAGAADQFGRWNLAGGRVLPGLTTRRAAERALYLGDA